ncbi:MAG: cell division protein FtsL [bacterium]|nr:cell division protein FtsL [bacterium]
MFQEGFFSGSPVFEIADKIKNREEIKTMILTSIFVLGIISIFLFYIYQRMEVREKVYSINQMQEEQKKLIEENRSLQLEVASLRSLERIERIARDQLGLDVPKDVRNLK